MKTSNFILRLCCIVLATIGTLTFTDGRTKTLSDGVRIIIRQTPLGLPGAPRSTAPFEAEYNEDLCCVLLTCTSPYGVVDTILESSAGDWYQTAFNTLDVSILIPVSGDSGYYTLTLVAFDGNTYVGEFIL